MPNNKALLDAVQLIPTLGPRRMTRAQYERERRLLKGYKLGALLKLDAVRISRLEHRHPIGAPATLRIAKALGVSPPEALYDEVTVDLRIIGDDE